MPISDDAQILQVPLKAQGAKSDDWASVRVNDLTQLNSVLRQLQEQFNKLNGRTGESAIRSGLTVAGAVTSGGALSGTSLTLGTSALVPSNPSFSPLVEAPLTPAALDYAPVLGAKADALSASPFTWTLSEHFIGGVATSGMIGELGWVAGGAIVAASSEASHPGIANLSDTASLYLMQEVAQADLSYIGMVLRPNASNRSNFKFGFLEPGAVGKAALGAYFCLANGNTSWQTFTRSAAGFQENLSGMALADGEWVLLEIVFSADAVDFYFNRTRLFRHTGVSVAAATLANLAFVQENDGNVPNVDYDRFVASGRGADKIWT